MKGDVKELEIIMLFLSALLFSIVYTSFVLAIYATIRASIVTYYWLASFMDKLEERVCNGK